MRARRVGIGGGLARGATLGAFGKNVDDVLDSHNRLRVQVHYADVTGFVFKYI